MIVDSIQYNRCRALSCAVILRALEDYSEILAKSGIAKAACSEVGRYFLEPGRRQYGFEWSCEQLDINPDRIRSRINTRGLMKLIRETKSIQEKYMRQRERQALG